MSELLLARRRSTKLYVDDVFQTFLRTGNGTSQRAIGPDMTAGGLVITKSRSSATGWRWCDTERGIGKSLDSSSTAAQLTEAGGVTSFDADGVTFGNDPDYNASGVAFVDYLFRNAPKFSTHDTFTHVTGTPTTINLATLGVVGYAHVKHTDSTSDWYAWHRSLTAGNNLRLNTTAAQSTTAAYISVTGTTLTFAAAAPSGRYVFHALAHDDSEDGIIQCGSYLGNGTGQTIPLGFEPQFVLIKNASQASDWSMFDVMRGMTVGGGNEVLRANTSGVASFSPVWVAPQPTATGFRLPDNQLNDNGAPHIYLSIRRPNKPPTSGTEVYKGIVRTGTGAAATIAGVGFPPDLVVAKSRSFSNHTLFEDRLRGADRLLTSSTTQAESVPGDTILGFDVMDGVRLGTDAGGYINTPATYSNHFFRRAPGVYDQICYNGSGANKIEAHTLLGVPPELWRAKRRNGTGSWVYGSVHLTAAEKILMPSPSGRVSDATVWNGAYPTKDAISLGTHADVNASGGTYMIEMWATLRGVSKVGKYVGNGATQNIECGFTTGARFIKIIRMTAGVAQDIFIWDTARGIIAANDPHLSLNSAAAEVTTDDSVDPYAGGFAVNQNAATNINVNGAEYLFLAYA